MNTPTPASATPKRRRIWPWMIGALLTPVFLFGLAAFSFLTLNREAATLRGKVMTATNAEWDTRVQLSIGRLTFGALRTLLSVVPRVDEDARLALRSVRHASVGVYELAGRSVNWSRETLFAETAKAMNRQGWTRLVGVADLDDKVMVYVANDADLDAPLDICVAVVNGRSLIVVSASVDGEATARLARRHADGKFSAQRRTHRL